MTAMMERRAMVDDDRNAPRTEHAWAVDALPWYLNGTLPQASVIRFEAHLGSCEACVQDVATERQLIRGLRERPLTEYVPHDSLLALNDRIDAYEKNKTGNRRTGSGVDASSDRGPRATSWLVYAQAAVIAILAIFLYQEKTAPEAVTGYRTLSSESQAAGESPRLQVVFEADMTTEDLRRLLIEIKGSVVRGPTEAGLFEIVLMPESQLTAVEAIDLLRAHPHVVFATDGGL